MTRRPWLRTLERMIWDNYWVFTGSSGCWRQWEEGRNRPQDHQNRSHPAIRAGVIDWSLISDWPIVYLNKETNVNINWVGIELELATCTRIQTARYDCLCQCSLCPGFIWFSSTLWMRNARSGYIIESFVLTLMFSTSLISSTWALHLGDWKEGEQRRVWSYHWFIIYTLLYLQHYAKYGLFFFLSKCLT